MPAASKDTTLNAAADAKGKAFRLDGFISALLKPILAAGELSYRWTPT